MLKKRKEYRKVGAIFLALGLLGMYLAIFEPIRMALQGAPSINTYLGGMVITPVLTILGGAYLFFPKFVERYLGFRGQRATDDTSVLAAVFFIVAFSIGIGLAIFRDQLTSTLGELRAQLRVLGGSAVTLPPFRTSR